jgi:hypothetical protein
MNGQRRVDVVAPAHRHSSKGRTPSTPNRYGGDFCWIWVPKAITNQDRVLLARCSAVQAVEAEKLRLRQLQEHQREMQETHKLLGTLPEMLSADVMVPFGRVAMFPGELLSKT